MAELKSVLSEISDDERELGEFVKGLTFVLVSFAKELAKKNELDPSKLPEWLTLKDAHELKGGCALGSVRRCPKLQPGGGVPDGKIGGKKVWRRETILEWLKIDDESLDEYLLRCTERRTASRAGLR